MEMPDMKICHTCGRSKPIWQFKSNRNNADGKSDTCKSCELSAKNKDKQELEKKIKDYEIEISVLKNVCSDLREKVNSFNRIYRTDYINDIRNKFEKDYAPSEIEAYIIMCSIHHGAGQGERWITVSNNIAIKTGISAHGCIYRLITFSIDIGILTFIRSKFNSDEYLKFNYDYLHNGGDISDTIEFKSLFCNDIFYLNGFSDDYASCPRNSAMEQVSKRNKIAVSKIKERGESNLTQSELEFLLTPLK